MKTARTRKLITLLMALALIFSLLAIAPLTVSAADTSPWSGVWLDEHSAAWIFWQDGDQLVGVSVMYDPLVGTISGNTFTGTITNHPSRSLNMTISADGQTITPNSGDYYNVKLTKVVDYSTAPADYNSSDGGFSWTGAWNVAVGTWGGMLIAQNGDNVTGYTMCYGGQWSGTVSGNVLTAKYLPGEPGGSSGTITLTMSSDGKSCKTDWNGSSWPDGTRLSPMTYVPAVLNGSDWAQTELQKAQSYGLIPDSLKSADLTKPITRAEFAAVSVKLYENLTGKTATPAAINPFTDTNDTDVLKAYNVGITAGTSATTFDPNVILDREQAATMLTRVLKAAYISGWTLATDGNFTLNFTQPAKFADDAKISEWAKPSVYFAAANNI
ncbi:MAG: hypothetical protein FWF44_11775, partial [Defluviitaleaceae bacterium]|nr:hypothetical protein [Defluviitaleaceae bacterium]